MSLTLKTAALARAAPREWAEFLAEWRSYADTKKDECIRAPVEVLQVAQGRAQNAVEMLNLFTKAK